MTEKELKYHRDKFSSKVTFRRNWGGVIIFYFKLLSGLIVAGKVRCNNIHMPHHYFVMTIGILCLEKNDSIDLCSNSILIRYPLQQLLNEYDRKGYILRTIFNYKRQRSWSKLLSNFHSLDDNLYFDIFQL